MSVCLSAFSEETKRGGCLATTGPTEGAATLGNTDMKLAELRTIASACELDAKTADGCPSMCGMCGPCVFAPEPRGFTRRPWKLSDEFKRRFVLDLLLRCRRIQVLESIHNVLSVTSWALSSYARSRSPAPRQDDPRPGADGSLHGKPLGVDTNKIWDWFSSSPSWTQSRYLCSILSRCEPELLRMAFNLTSVLLIRHKRHFLQCNSSAHTTGQHEQDNDEDAGDPALMVIPGSRKSVSGVSRYRDFIGCLPVDLSKRILGLLEEHTLRHCQKVCRYWQRLAKETLEEMQFRRSFQDQVKAMMTSCRAVDVVSPTYASFVKVLIPTQGDETDDIDPSAHEVRPFEAAYAKIKTKTVQMEERNVYCGAYFIKMLLNKEDRHRVVDYGGGALMATGSMDRTVQLLYVACETKVVSVMKGHVASIRAVLLCEDRGLVITASGDASIRCWDLKTDRCELTLYGHTGFVTCLDVHADTLVSGAKDCRVKVWSLNTGKHFEGFNFKHPACIKCVKIRSTKVYSSCDRGLVKIWDVEKASIVRAIDAHRSSVKCLFLDEWHLLSGDMSGQVMAWSTSCHATERLTTFIHPQEVRSVTLVYLRVVTGCVDGIIRVFDFLTGDCLRAIAAEAGTGRLLSLRFTENSILVNTTSSVKLYQFAKVFWDYTDSPERGPGDVSAPSALVSETTGASHRKLPRTCKPASTKVLQHTRCPAKGPTLAGGRYETDRRSLMLSEKATSERIKKRGLHHPLTRDSLLLRVSALQRAQCEDEVSVNMEHNARLRDSWGPHALRDPPGQSLQTRPPWPSYDHQPRAAKTCVTVSKRAASQNVKNTPRQRDADAARRRGPGFSSKKASQLQSDVARRESARVGTSTKEGPQAHPGYCRKTSTSLRNINTSGPMERAGGLQGGHRKSLRR